MDHPSSSALQASLDDAELSGLSHLALRQRLTRPICLANYYPVSKDDFYITRFNFIKKVPDDLKTQDEIASWLIHETRIKRRSVFEYLNRSDDLSNLVLASIVKMLILSEAEYPFANSLRKYIPIIGLHFMNKDNLEWSKESITRYLTIFANVHINLGRDPLIVEVKSNFSIIFDISYNLYIAVNAVSLGERSLSAISNEFMIATKISARADRNALMPMKVISELCDVIASGFSFDSIAENSDNPTYMMCNKEDSSSFVEISLNFDDVLSTKYAILTRNAIYVYNEINSLAVDFVVPLDFVTAERTVDFECNNRLELLGCDSDEIPIIIFSNSHTPLPQSVLASLDYTATTTTSVANKHLPKTMPSNYYIPSRIEFCSRIFIDILGNDESKLRLASNADFNSRNTSTTCTLEQVSVLYCKMCSLVL